MCFWLWYIIICDVMVTKYAELTVILFEMHDIDMYHDLLNNTAIIVMMHAD